MGEVEEMEFKVGDKVCLVHWGRAERICTVARLTPTQGILDDMKGRFRLSDGMVLGKSGTIKPLTPELEAEVEARVAKEAEAEALSEAKWRLRKVIQELFSNRDKVLGRTAIDGIAGYLELKLTEATPATSTHSAP